MPLSDRKPDTCPKAGQVSAFTSQRIRRCFKHKRRAPGMARSMQYASIGRGAKVDLHLETQSAHNILITTRLVDTVTTPMLLKTVQSKKLAPELLITHRFALGQMMGAYETFGSAAKSRALKVLIST